MSNTKLKTIVCGTTFGQFYCEALTRLTEYVSFNGILSTGSERSKKCAEKYGVKCYTSIDDLDSDISLACVVARSSVLGGKGTNIALDLLSKGINVIQEQPVHFKDIEECIKVAKKNKVFYCVGDLYKFLPHIRKFIDYSKEICKISKPLYLDIGSASQVLYPMVEVLSEALPSLRPFKIDSVNKNSQPFHFVHGSINDIPTLFQIHNEVNPEEPDNYMHYLHKITIITSSGRLCLEDTQGPVRWHSKMHVPLNSDMLISSNSADVSSKELDTPCSVEITTCKERSFKSVFFDEWIYAISENILAFIKDIQSNNVVSFNKYYTKLILNAKIWQQITSELGFPVLINPDEVSLIDIKKIQDSLN